MMERERERGHRQVGRKSGYGSTACGCKLRLGATWSDLERPKVQLSLWQGHCTEGFIVICNYVVFFLWGLSLVRSHTEALFSWGILSSRTEGGWGLGHC